jgi:hypothetical protein
MPDDRPIPKVEEIVAVTFRCSPLILTEADRNTFHEIRSVEVVVYAKNLEEAEVIMYNRTANFFDQNLNVAVLSQIKGYREVK